MKKIELDCGLELTIDAETGNGSITSSLRDGCHGLELTIDAETGNGSITKDECHDDYWDTAIDAVESLVLAHACAGVDVEARDYQKGLETSLEALANNLGG